MTVGRTFGRVAAAYARTRPLYPAAALDRAADKLELRWDSRVLDLGAGTGILTRALRERFEYVIAVEPDAAMRAFVDDALDGTAERIPLPDDAVDAVFVGEAFHWFEFEQALSEIRRVLRPGGGLAVLMRSWGEPEQPGLLPTAFKEDLDRVWTRFHPQRQQFPNWRDVVRPEGPERFVETVLISGVDLVDLHLTASTPASLDDAEREAIAKRAYL